MSDDYKSTKDWMLTQSRRKVRPLAFRADDVDIDDIAQSLGYQCRYNGHVDRYYSVAEHSVLVSRALQRDGYDLNTVRTGLLHDAAECYTGDMIRPLKNAMREHGFDPKPFEVAIEETISRKFGLAWPWPAVIEQYDTAIIRDEKDQIKHDPSDDWSAYGVPAAGLGVKIVGWGPQEATAQFSLRFVEVFGFDY